MTPHLGTAGPRRRPRVDDVDDRGSMAILMMVALVGLMLSALLIPSIITQSRASRFDATRVQALDAAQAGLDMMTGSIRAGVTSGIGDSAKLPCGTRSGPVAAGSVATYSVTVEYFTFNPAGEPSQSPLAMQCIPGSGTYDTDTGSSTPSFARITSSGSAGSQINGASGPRTLTGTYVFRTSNVNILGGQLQLSSDADSLCLDAGTARPAVNSPVVLQACSTGTPPAAQQVFAYRSDLTLQLISSITTGNPKGLCLTPVSTPAVAGDAVRLTQCGVLGVPRLYTQQWSYNDSGQYQAAQADSVLTGTLPNLCINVATAAAGQPAVVGACSSRWIPSASVGAGAAALPQWINYSEFGRCLDVTGQRTSATYLITYPCKQNPFPGAKTWNQLFEAPAIPEGVGSATGQIFTLYNGNFCLTSPGVAGGYATVKPCVAGDTTQTWTINGGDPSLNYSVKYTLVNRGLCLGLAAPNATLPAWSTIVVSECSGALDQKWNASPNLLNATLTDVSEVFG